MPNLDEDTKQKAIEKGEFMLHSGEVVHGPSFHDGNDGFTTRHLDLRTSEDDHQGIDCGGLTIRPGRMGEMGQLRRVGDLGVFFILWGGLSRWSG